MSCRHLHLNNRSSPSKSRAEGRVRTGSSLQNPPNPETPPLTTSLSQRATASSRNDPSGLLLPTTYSSDHLQSITLILNVPYPLKSHNGIYSSLLSFIAETSLLARRSRNFAFSTLGVRGSWSLNCLWPRSQTITNSLFLATVQSPTRPIRCKSLFVPCVRAESGEVGAIL